MSSQYGELRLNSGWDRSGSLGHPCKFQLVSRLGSVTPRHLAVGVSQTAALNRGRHLYSAGRPSRLALAHISSCYWDTVQLQRCCADAIRVLAHWHFVSTRQSTSEFNWFHQASHKCWLLSVGLKNMQKSVYKLLSLNDNSKLIKTKNKMCA